MTDFVKKLGVWSPISIFAIVACLFLGLFNLQVAFAEEGEIEGDDATASLSWVESDGEHVKEKNLFETERVDFTLPVLDASGNAVDGVKFQIWNATTQTNEAAVYSADGKISVSLLKNHNYILFPIDKTWEGKTYVWVRDGKLVSTKSLTKDSLESPTVWSYPEVTQVTLSKRTTELDNADDARRHTFRWYLKRQGSDIALANQTVEFVSTLETVQGSVFTGSGMTTISASLLEDVDYMVIYKSPSGVTLGVEPSPIVYKDKSEYPSQYSDYWPVASTYDHRCCQQVTYFNVIGQSEIGSTWDSIKTDDGNTVVEGMDFTDEQSGRYPTLHTQTLNQEIASLTGSDYTVYSIKAMNTARSETFKVAGMDFKITQTIDSGKTVKAVYELNSDGSLSQLDTFTQVDDTVKFTTKTLSDKPVVIEYTTDAPAVNRVLNVKVVDEEGNAVRGTQLVLRYPGDKEENNIALPATDAYGETSWTCTNDVFLGDYRLDSYSYSSSHVIKMVDVKLSQDSTGNTFVDAVDGEAYSGLVTVTVKSPVNRSILKVKAVDGAGQPVEGISLKLIPDPDNETHYTDNVYFTNLTNRDGVTSLDISDLIVGDGSTEYWTLDVTSGQDGEASNIYKLKASSMISISDDDSADSPGINEWDIIPADPTQGIEYSSKSYEGVVQLNVIKNSVVQYETGATHAQAPSYQIIENGTKLQEPQLETDGTPLLGWYTDKKFTNKWDFENDVVKENMTLYANWGLTRLAGLDCYETNYQTLKKDVDLNGAPKGVIICCTGHYIDSLSAAALSGLLDYPIVLVNGTSSSMNDAAVRSINLISDNGKNPIDVVILGGKFAISEGIEAQLNAYDSDASCTRIYGDDGYDTNKAVYEYGDSIGDGWNEGEVLIATGASYHDALGAGSYAASKKSFILLANPNSDNSELVQKAVAHKNARVLGGVYAVSQQLASNLEDAGVSVSRLAGDDAYATNIEFVKFALDNGLKLDGAGFSTGRDYYDALGSSHILGASDSVMFLVALEENYNQPVYSEIESRSDEISYGFAFGGTAVITDETFVNIRDAAAK
ncbi:MAG: cell wall-binding repeat-containing protein [Phoenicibacter congonensis]|uniref:Cell wall-binding repeat-containing protein n=1 Tax=Phoenicibacter congonensis TaxID=1944646 RepID=A0AA43RHV0_9ACTN|nr:cell wall-binding repeat-containing protein [Phoenicibacter congonensis]